MGSLRGMVLQTQQARSLRYWFHPKQFSLTKLGGLKFARFVVTSYNQLVFLTSERRTRLRFRGHIHARLAAKIDFLFEGL